MATPRKGKARVKITASGKKVSYGQKGARIGKRGSAKQRSYCARSAGQLKRFRKPLRILTRPCGFLENAGSVKQRARLDCQKHFLLHRQILNDPTSGRKYSKSLMLWHGQGAFAP